MKTGAHIWIGGGLEKVIEISEALSCDCFQIFLQNPRSWSRKERDTGEIANFKEGVVKNKIAPLVVHMPYLLNLASPDKKIRAMSLKLFEHEIDGSEKIGADFYVIHPGSHKGAGLNAGIKTLAENLKNFVGGPVKIIIENTAGQGNSVGGRWENFEPLLAQFGSDIGFCLDTAHAFEAGYNIREEEGFREMAESIAEHIGLDRILMVHANDSATMPGSKSDRHAGIGQGYLGTETFERLIKDTYFGELPFIIETPKNDIEDDRKNLSVLREIGARHGKI